MSTKMVKRSKSSKSKAVKRGKASAVATRASETIRAHAYVDRVPVLVDTLRKMPEHRGSVRELHKVLAKHPLFQTNEKQRTVAGIWRQAQQECIDAGIDRDHSGYFLTAPVRKPKSQSKNGKISRKATRTAK